MRIAITVENENGLESQVAQHFGRSPFFAFIELEGEAVNSIEVLPNPFVGGHRHGQVPAFINEHNAEVMISGGMGRGAVNHFQNFGIETATGADGSVQQTLEKFFKGELSKDASCGHAGHSHQHGHGHGQGGCSHD
jgi:predicted Fe-Mo cluster-binding NifX family protein